MNYYWHHIFIGVGELSLMIPSVWIHAGTGRITTGTTVVPRTVILWVIYQMTGAILSRVPVGSDLKFRHTENFFSSNSNSVLAAVKSHKRPRQWSSPTVWMYLCCWRGQEQISSFRFYHSWKGQMLVPSIKQKSEETKARNEAIADAFDSVGEA
jgi:hypothetical protein